MKLSIKGFFSKCDQIRRNLRIEYKFTEEILNGRLHFCAVYPLLYRVEQKKKDSFTEIVITWSKSYEILQIHTEIYLRELSIINIALYADLLLQLHVEV